MWKQIKDGTLAAWWIASRHYTHQRDAIVTNCPDWGLEITCTAFQILPPGRKLLALTESRDALVGFVHQRYRRDHQEGIYLSIFRNDSPTLSSVLIRHAVQMAHAYYGVHRIFTFVDPSKIRSTNPGACFKLAGFTTAGTSAKGLHILEIIT